MKKIIVKSGDVFVVRSPNGQYAFFQVIEARTTNLGADMIRGFKNHSDMVLDASIVVMSEVLFYTHAWILHGYKLNLWNRIGNIPIEDTFEKPFFRVSDPIEDIPNDHWSIWRGDEPWKYIGKLDDTTRKIPLADVFPPEAIVSWLHTGDHGFNVE